jgi:hypothetical protein
MQLESDIISGDIGSVRNNLARLVKNEVKEVVSISQSSYSQNMLTVIIIYVPKSKECDDKTVKVFSPISMKGETLVERTIQFNDCGCAGGGQSGGCQCKS